MKNKKALAGVLLSLSLAGGIVAPASVAFATDETPAAETVAEAPVAEAPAPTAEVITEAPVTEAPAPAAEPVVTEVPATEAPAPAVAEAPAPVEAPVAEAVTPTAPAVAEAPAVEDAPAPATEAAPAEDTSIIVYVEIYQNEMFLFQGIKPVVVEQGEDLVAVALSRSGGLTGEYGIFLRGEIEYLNEGAAVVKLYFSTAVTTTTEATTTTASPEPTTTTVTTEATTTTASPEPTTTTVTTEPTTTEVPTTEAPTTEAPTTEAPSTVQISFHLDGGTLQGQTGTVTLEARIGDVITLPEAPTREGYKFLYWKGSVYQPGANYTVTGPKTFTAVWEPVAKQATTTTSASETPQKILPATGDPGSLLSLVGLGVAGFAGLLGLKRPRKN